MSKPAIRRLRRLVALSVLIALAVVACGGDGDSGPPYEVYSEQLSHETTQEVAVFAPDAEGTWPVVFAYHGFTGQWEDMAETATRLAREGHLVFSANYRTSETTGFSLREVEQDAECAYRFGRSIAADYGGDLQRPVTMLGTSLGATVAIEHGLQLTTFGPGGTYGPICFTGQPRPDLIVGISGCYYQSGFHLQRYTNPDATLVLIAGENDNECSAQESERAATEFEGAGYDATYLLLEGANHHTPIFHDVIDGEYVLVPDDPAGELTVQTIRDAIAAADG